MKINIGRLAQLLLQLALAAPAVVAAIKPVVDAAKQPSDLAGS